jgi:hypothetical protein
VILVLSFLSISPSFLVRLIKKYNIELSEVENFKAGEELFSSFEIDRMHVASLLFQTGYLTIKQIVPSSRRKRFYILSYLNLEVKEAFLVYLLGDFSPGLAERISVLVDDLKSNLEKDQMERFFEILRLLFAGIPYDIFVKDREAYYQTVIYLVLMLIGIDIKTEVKTNRGCIDVVMETEDHIYVLEFKLDTANNALSQIKEKKYYEKYLSSHKGIKLIGVAFDPEQPNLGEYKVETLR